MRVWQIAELLGVSADYLGEHGSSSPRLDVELLLAEVLGLGRVDLYTQFDRPLGADEVDRFRELVARRAKHEPVAYILGRAGFRYATLKVSPAVLIPRPETEELVGAVLAWLKERPLALGGAAAGDSVSGATAGGAEAEAPLIADVGTGSGAIALSLAAEAGVRVLAVESSRDALAVAEENRDALGLEDLVELRATDLLDGVVPGSLRVVVSNPPYVSVSEYEGLAPDVRDFEPAAALTAGDDGLAVYRRLVPQAHAALGPGGALFLEVGETQAAAVADQAGAAGFALMDVIRDLSGKERIVRAVKAGAPEVCTRELVGEGGAAVVAALGGALERGGIIGVPTDTVYGLASSWLSAAGVRRLFEAKGRGEAKPVGVLFSSVAAVREALPDLDPAAARVFEALLPGPYTFVVATGVARPPFVGTEDSLGVRVPAHPPLRELLAALDVPLAATSANLTGAPDVAGPDEADGGLLAHCVVALTLGESAAGLPSTVVDLRPLATGGLPTVLREGAVSADEVRAAMALVT
ncbi:MAG: peptide chain release factor N(5)-glutamine methyltransferase [Thermoleophilia bacterium]